MKKISKLLCIGSNCLAADFTKFLGVREKGPVDNFSKFNIWKSQDLFSTEFKKDIFKSQYKIQKATPEEKQTYFYKDEIFVFDKGFSIVHSDFRTRKFRKSIKHRIRSFKKYYKKSQKDDSLWYIYSLDYEDAFLDANSLFRIKKSLPQECSDRLIVLGIRAKNPLFKDYFNYYLELDSEKNYKWGDKSQGIEIATRLEKEYNLKIEY